MSEHAAFQEAFAEAMTAARPIGRVAREPGFAVYRNTWLHGTVEALRATYPSVDELLGDEMFAAVAAEFCRRTPLRDPVLTRYGASFGPFLRRQPWHDDLPYLADVARLDRLWLESFCAGDLCGTGGWQDKYSDRRATVPVLDPTTRFVWLDTPAVSIWLAIQGEEAFEGLEPAWVAEGALFVQRHGRIWAQAIDRLTHRTLLAIAAGNPLSDIAALARAEAIDPATVLQPLVTSGAIQLH